MKKILLAAMLLACLGASSNQRKTIEAIGNLVASEEEYEEREMKRLDILYHDLNDRLTRVREQAATELWSGRTNIAAMSEELKKAGDRVKQLEGSVNAMIEDIRQLSETAEQYRTNAINYKVSAIALQPRAKELACKVELITVRLRDLDDE